MLRYTKVQVHVGWHISIPVREFLQAYKTFNSKIRCTVTTDSQTLPWGCFRWETNGENYNCEWTHLSKRHFSGPVPRNLFNSEQFLKVTYGTMVIRVGEKDSYVQIDGNTVCKVMNIVRFRSQVIVVYKAYEILQDAYDYPIKSSQLGIYKISGLGNTLFYTALGNITLKYFCMPLKDEWYVIVPIRHSVKSRMWSCIELDYSHIT